MNYRCPHCDSDQLHSKGSFKRVSDSKIIRRWRCLGCARSFSQATFSQAIHQNKRRLNPLVRKLYSSGLSQRRMAIVLGATRKTIARKIQFLGSQAKQNHQAFLTTVNQEELSHLQFDELLTSHHTKLKPLSLSVVCSKKSRKILAVELSQIPSFGHLAKISIKKYGRRPRELRRTLNRLFAELNKILPASGIIESDEHQFYPRPIKKHLPNWLHLQHKSVRASVVGQGELKRIKWDPLFSINHTFAMMRANINRLFRRTWNTTKSLEMLMHHVWIYVEFHNTVLTK